MILYKGELYQIRKTQGVSQNLVRGGGFAIPLIPLLLYMDQKDLVSYGKYNI